MSSRPRVLVTGGAGYIGSHAAVALHEAGFMPVLLDNLSNAKRTAVESVRQLCGDPELPFHEVDVQDASGLREVFEYHQKFGHAIVGILHFAAFKAVGESVAQPARYAANNVGGLGTLLDVADAFNVRNVVFSSSCTVYGEPDSVPVDESTPFQDAESPYGWTKQACATAKMVNNADWCQVFSYHPMVWCVTGFFKRAYSRAGNCGFPY